MIAICPAGPPKLIIPSFSQNRNASDSLGFTAPSAVSAALAGRSAEGIRDTAKRYCNPGSASMFYRSCTNTSWKPFASAETRLVAVEQNATWRPSELSGA
jgi:hypothetical protein